MRKKLEDYTERMGLFPSMHTPKLLSSDDEFNYYKFAVPRVYVEFIERGDEMTYEEMEEAPAALAMGWFPVHVGIEELGSDADFYYYKVPVPQVVVESRYGVLYRPYEEW